MDENSDMDSGSSHRSSDFSHSGTSHDSSRMTDVTPNKSESSSDHIASEGALAVLTSKVAVLFVLGLAALGVGYATFASTSSAEETTFEKQFHAYSQELIALVHAETDSIYLAMEAFGSTVTSYVQDEETANWPLVDIPHFEMRGYQSNALSGALMMIMSPLVPLLEREDWESYATENQGWIQEGIDFNPELRDNYTSVPGYELENISYPIWHYGLTGEPVHEQGRGPYLPVWQTSPAPYNTSIVNYNLLDNPVFARVFHGMEETDLPVLSEVTDLTFLYEGVIDDDATHPHSFLLYPLHETFDELLENPSDPNPLIGALTAVLPWDHYFAHLLPKEVFGMVVVVKDTCGDVFTYQVDGPDATFMGQGDHHDPKYEGLVEVTDFVTLFQHNFSDTHEHCEYFLHIYPSQSLHVTFLSSSPALYTSVVVLVFILTTMVFVMYDFFVQQRNQTVVMKAKRSNAIVSALFPKNIRDRIMKEAEEQMEAEMDSNKKRRFGTTQKTQLRSFLSDDGEKVAGVAFAGKPIADLFPSATVMFADIAGFTAWSSVREPTQVFSLLETLYAAFDEIAARRRVFKVETIGDCYVAVAGLPEPRKDHATVMARFARDCMSKMNDLTKLLEVSLGPDTGDLAIRVGLHSGPVTAGVLRGEKARFQLFGDTVNTASRMESCGVRNKIHISNDTAEHMRTAGKQHWLVKRDEKVVAKGKGEMETYFLELKVQSSGSATSKSTNNSESESNQANNMDASLKSLAIKDGLGRQDGPQVRTKLSSKANRLVKWNVEIISRLLKQVIARRNETNQVDVEGDPSEEFTVTTSRFEGTTVIDEVKEIIQLPEFDVAAAKNQQDPATIELDEKVQQQLFDYVALIASMYRDVPFHNFEHASHVTMSVTKLLSRIVAPDDILTKEDDNDQKMSKNLHDHTFGITSDPLTQLAVVMAALIHDVDHTGVGNAQLVKEECEIASIYKNKSVAEQNSIDIAWELLMDPSFADLRHAIYGTGGEKKRFRQLLVNVVLATDIVDKELKGLRDKRWETAFYGENAGKATQSRDENNRKATIILEHLIQASDISHTMQHWHVYRKWNERFFEENMKAYKEGRMEKDPSEFWYKGEIGFFDFYIIPLAKKLKECGVFGVSCDEYLNYAKQNRTEWELRGEEITAEMVAKWNAK